MAAMITVITTVKLIAEIALLALAGQWLLGLLAGAKRDKNFFYQILQIMCKPFIVLARVMTPKFVLDRHLPLVAGLMLAFIWVGVTVLKIQTCMEIGIANCQ